MNLIKQEIIYENDEVCSFYTNDSDIKNQIDDTRKYVIKTSVIRSEYRNWAGKLIVDYEIKQHVPNYTGWCCRNAANAHIQDIAREARYNADLAIIKYKQKYSK